MFMIGSLRQILYTRVYKDWNFAIDYKKHSIILSDGGTISIDWALPKIKPNGKLVAVLPGMGAHSNFGYIKSLVKVLLENGYEVAVLHA